MPSKQLDAIPTTTSATVVYLRPRSCPTLSRPSANLLQPARLPVNATPTLFVDFDGTLHVGHAAMDEYGTISLDTGRPLFEFAPVLIDLLMPYPTVELVLTTSWLLTLSADQVTELLPYELARRVVDTTRHVRPRLCDVLKGIERTQVISRYAAGKQLKHWLAIDGSVFAAEQFGRERSEYLEHFLLLESSRGLGDFNAIRRVEGWLTDVHSRRDVL